MTHCERMDQPIAITLTDGDWLVIQGLLTREWSDVRKERDNPPLRAAYFETLTRIRQTIIARTP